MATRNPLRSPRLIQARRKMFKMRFIIAGVLILATLIGIVSFTRMDALTIKEVRVEASETFPKQEALALIEGVLDESYLWLFPKRNALLYPEQFIVKELTEQFPRSESVTIHREGFEGLSVSFKERKPHVLWCAHQEEEKEQVGEGKATDTPKFIPERCYFADEKGFIFAPAPGFSGSAYLIFYTSPGVDTEGGRVEPISTQIIDEATFASLNAFIASIGKLGLAARTVFIQNDYYEVQLAGGARIIIPRDKPFGDVLEIVQSVLAESAFDTAGIEGIEYIDLRFGKKVYYKRK